MKPFQPLSAWIFLDLFYRMVVGVMATLAPRRAADIRANSSDSCWMV